MVMIHSDRYINMPPPAYQSQSITVSVFYGGVTRNLPIAKYIAPEEVAVEGAETVDNGQKNNKSNSKVKAKVRVRFLGETDDAVGYHDEVGTDDVGLNASENVETGVGDVGAHNVDLGIDDVATADEDDFEDMLENEYDMDDHCSEDDDELFGNNVDGNREQIREDLESNSEYESDDVVASENDLNNRGCHIRRELSQHMQYSIL
ncbi:UNVERIFIED_CONTAM: hypothetical protein Slati_1367700 [Sesamum latifolium]|uniref:Uncharacterized protein n=1 Tax=Sesamum latifolium TaxID=2727402 RepID=A0AAW2XNX0_9LAMI